MNAQLSRKPVFLYDCVTGQICSGWREEVPAPYGFQKIVCTSAHEAEVWSERQRKWDTFRHQLAQEEREMIEGPMRDRLRSELLHLKANARNNLNRDFLGRAIETVNQESAKWKYKRESYLHAEGFEAGH